MRWTLALLLVLLLVPAANARLGRTNPEDAPVTLHFHMDGFQDFPINTQPARFDGWEAVESAAAHSLGCAPDTPVTGLDQGFHTYYGFSTPSYVEYGVTLGGRPRMWPERQLGYHTTLDVGMPPILHWYLETTAPLADGLPMPPQPIPQVVVEATLRVGDSISVDDKAYDTGPIIAHGRSEPALLAAQFSDGVEHSMVGDRHVYHFTVPLAIEQSEVGAVGYILRVDAYIDDPACETGGPMVGTVEPFADAEHRPRLETGVLRPLRVEALTPAFDGDWVVINGSVMSVWGNYDVDEGNLTLTVEGPGTRLALAPTSVVQRYAAYYHHADPVEVTWVWDRSDAPDGYYWLNLTATNDQRTANATAVAAVQLGPDRAFAAAEELPEPVQAMPAGPPGALLLALAAFVALRRRP